MLVTVSATQGQSGAMRAEDAIKDFWATRPRRPRRGRKIAGVAAGIGARYRIDPMLVRVGLVVAAIYGGAGILVYLLGWLFLPEQDDEVSPVESLLGKGRSSTSSGFTLLLCIGLIPVFGWFFGGSFLGEFSSWMSLVVIGGLLFLLHQSRGHLSAPEPAPAAAPTTEPVPPFMATASDAPLAAPTISVPEERTAPPAWDPLGAAPFAWDLPEPATPEPEEPEPPARRRKKSRIGMATIGMALVVAAGMSVMTGGWITPAHIVGVTLAILGLGMVAGAFVRGGRGLIALAVPLSVAGLALTSIGPEGWNGLGNLDASPTTVAQVERDYERSVGNVDLDLTGMPTVGDVRTRVSVGVGNATVLVPANADVEVKCKTDRGNIDCLSVSDSGLDKEAELTDVGADGPGGLKIDLTVSTDTGNVEVRRG
jgi:phage shock protein PspC (stress-responsive transcriptional regulator)